MSETKKTITIVVEVQEDDKIKSISVEIDSPKKHIFTADDYYIREK